MTFIRWSTSILVVASFWTGGNAVGAELSAYELKEPLGRDWKNEFISFPVTPDVLKLAKQGRRLTDGKREVIYQVMEPSGKLGALVDVEAGKQLQLRFEDSAADLSGGVVVTESDAGIRLSNSKIELLIPKTLEGNEGPLKGLKSAGAKDWLVGSKRNSDVEFKEYRAEVAKGGPAEAVVKCEMVDLSGKKWEITYTLQANEPVVKVSEAFNLGGDRQWTVNLLPAGPGTNLFFRAGKTTEKGKPGLLMAAPLSEDGEPLFTWVPWVSWWERLRQGKWFGIFRDDSNELVFVGARDADLWLRPPVFAGKNDQIFPIPSIKVKADDGLVRFDLPLVVGQRHWLIGILPKDQCLAAIGENEGFAAPLPQQYVIKSEFPLERVKGDVLTWKHAASHPRLFIKDSDLEQIRANPDSKALFDVEKLLRGPVLNHRLDEWISAYWVTGDERVRARLLEFNLEQLQIAVDFYLAQGHSYSLGYAPHHNFGTLISAINLADTVLAFPDLPEETRSRMLAQIAFLGYVLERRDHWWPEGKYSGNPNMTSMVAAMQVAVGSVIPDHPRSPAWVKMGLDELLTQLHEWSDDNGGWVEAPHYAIVAFDSILGALAVVPQTGEEGQKVDKKVKQIARWFAKIQTPPDTRFGGLRHLPTIGHTWINERTSLFGLLAAIWKDKDPQFAAEMMWMHDESGRPTSTADGGFCASFVGYKSMLSLLTPKPEAPKYGSELFPETGAVMRNGFPSDHETMLYVIAGQNHDHYDFDSGSVTLWGKGKVLAEDFGYYGRAPKDDHNLVDSLLSKGERMEIDSFSTSPDLDFFQGTEEGYTRQILFVKDPNPLKANYFVLNDDLRVPVSAKWRMWFDAREVTLDGKTAIVKGAEGVDTAVTFVRPETVTLTTESRGRTSYGTDANFRWDKVTRTLQGVIASSERSNGFTSVIFPMLSGEIRPKVTSLEDGRVVVVSGEGWKHFIMASKKPFVWKSGDMEFEGTVGAILKDGDRTRVALGASGKIKSGPHQLESKEAASKTFQKP